MFTFALMISLDKLYGMSKFPMMKSLTYRHIISSRVDDETWDAYREVKMHGYDAPEIYKNGGKPAILACRDEIRRKKSQESETA